MKDFVIHARLEAEICWLLKENPEVGAMVSIYSHILDSSTQRNQTVESTLLLHCPTLSFERYKQLQEPRKMDMALSAFQLFLQKCLLQAPSISRRRIRLLSLAHSSPPSLRYVSKRDLNVTLKGG